MLQICGWAECHPHFNESCEKPCSEWKASRWNHIGEPGHPAFSLAPGCIKSFDELEEQIYLCRIGFCIDSLTSSSESCGAVTFLKSGVCVCLCMSLYTCVYGKPWDSRWTQWCDLHESAGGCNYQQPMQNLPNLYWHRFKQEAPHSADLSLTPLFAPLSEHNRDTFIQRAVRVFSAWGRGRQIKSFSPRSLHSHCVVVITTAWKGMFGAGRTHDCILLSSQCVLSDEIITAFYCFTAKWLT